MNHRHFILSRTKGHPARWNDKTLVLHDEFIIKLKEESILNDVKFNVKALDDNSNEITRKIKGWWVIVDNGYLFWSQTIPPYTNPVYMKEKRFSHWLESMHKDVECTFSIVKGRFRVFKAPIRLHGINVVDKIWLTCCALQNWLLLIDGKNVEWTSDQPYNEKSDLLGELGEFGRMDLPHVLRDNLSNVPYDLSGMGVGNDRYEIDNDLLSNDEYLQLNELKMNEMRETLVNHFAIEFKNNNVVWPRVKTYNM